MFLSQKTVIINREGKILALRRSSTDPSRPLTWDLPGGLVEDGETLEESVVRELQEEAGFAIEKFTILDAVVGNSQGTQWVQICYVEEVDLPEVILSYEHDQYEWLTKEEFLKLESSEKIKRFLNKL